MDRWTDSLVATTYKLILGHLVSQPQNFGRFDYSVDHSYSTAECIYFAIAMTQSYETVAMMLISLNFC